MFKREFLCFPLSFFVVFFSFNVSRGEDNKRQQLRDKFVPSGNIVQIQNIRGLGNNSGYTTAEQFNFEKSGHKKSRLSPSPALEQMPIIGEYAIYQSEYGTEIEEEIAFVEGRIKFEVFKKTGRLKIPLVDSSVGLKEVSLNGKPSFVIREGNSYVLLVDKPGKYNLNLEFFIKVKREREHGPGSLSFRVLPSPVSILDVEMQENSVDIFVEPSIKIETEKLPKKTLATVVLPFTEKVTVRWSKALLKEVIPKVVLEPKIYVNVATLASIGDGVAKCFTNLRYSILQSEVSNLSVSFPKDIGILDVSGNQLRDWKVKANDGRKILDVYFNYGVKGSYSLNLIYERNIGAGSVTAQIPEIHVLGAKRERGFVGIEVRSNIELAFNKLEDAYSIDVKELPQQVWAKAKNPILLAFKYLKFPYNVIIDVTKHHEVPVLVATIDTASYVTLFTEEGKVLTKATYQTRNNVKQFVRLSLPKDASLWSCFVSGKPVKPAKDKKGKILIPLEKSEIQGEILTQFPVEVVYLTIDSNPRSFGKLKLKLPKLDIPQNELFWSVYLPGKFKYWKFDGDVRLTKRVRVPSAVVNKIFRTKNVRQRKEKLHRLGGLERSARRVIDTPQTFYKQQVMQSEIEEQVFEDIKDARIQGVLPIKIDIPKSGRLYRFSKLLITDESPWMSVSYVLNWKPLGWVIFFIVLIGIIVLLIRKPHLSRAKK